MRSPALRHAIFPQKSARGEQTILTPAILFFLLSTVLLGLVLRFQMAGWATWGAALDLRRAHSHLGFYGVLFPISWGVWREVGASTPRGGWLFFYILMVLVSITGFLFQGYGLVSIIASNGVLLVWLRFAWKNGCGAGLLKSSWLATAASSTVLSSLMLVPVVVAKQHDPGVSAQLARVFLTLLLFGVFVPSILKALGGAAPRAGLWILCVLAGAFSLTELSPTPWLSLGLVAVGAMILRSLSQRVPTEAKNPDRGLLAHWIIFAVGLLGVGLHLLPAPRAMVIAGIHYLVLGPILMGFALLRLRLSPPLWLRASYEVSLLGMVAGIGLQGFSTTHYLLLQRGTAVCSAAMLTVMGGLGARHLLLKLNRIWKKPNWEAILNP